MTLGIDRGKRYSICFTANKVVQAEQKCSHDQFSDSLGVVTSSNPPMECPILVRVVIIVFDDHLGDNKSVLSVLPLKAEVQMVDSSWKQFFRPVQGKGNGRGNRGTLREIRFSNLLAYFSEHTLSANTGRNGRSFTVPCRCGHE
jgi:hypothetical protein